MLGQLRRIASGTRGEHSIDDLKNEAWLAAKDICDETGIECEPDDSGLQAAVLARLRNAFGQFVNRKMRFAVQLDQERTGDDGELLPNSLAASLAASDVYEPEIALELAEEAVAAEEHLAGRFTEAVAYLRTLDRFGNDCAAAATYLAITTGAFRSRLARAETVAVHQPSLFDGTEIIPRDFLPLRGRALLVIAKASVEWRRICAVVVAHQQSLFSRGPTLFQRR